jgi:phosphoribosylaminoimidazole carboxylase
MLKNKKLAYDGRGNAVVRSAADVAAAYAKLGGRDVYAEKWIPFVKELAVMVANTATGAICYPVVETVQENNICHLVFAPAMISSAAMTAAQRIAKQTIESFSGYGVFGVELFLLADESILVNEIAPRPHNSGHYSMEACEIDQFEIHLRAILGLPCPSTAMRVSSAIMINILGKSSMEETREILIKALGIPGCGIHWYGKAESREGRKMAHITVTGDSYAIVANKVQQLGIDLSPYGYNPASPRVGIIMGSDSDLDTMKDAAEILDYFQIAYELTIVSAHRTPTRMYSYAQSAAERGIQVIIAGAGGAAHLPGMVAALTSLPVIGVPVKTSTLNGQDSLLSIVQMPKGIPVATVAIGNAANAGLLAVRILGAQDSSLQKLMDGYLLSQEDEVLIKAKKLESMGYQAYLSSKK